MDYLGFQPTKILRLRSGPAQPMYTGLASGPGQFPPEAKRYKMVRVLVKVGRMYKDIHKWSHCSG